VENIKTIENKKEFKSPEEWMRSPESGGRCKGRTRELLEADLWYGPIKKKYMSSKKGRNGQLVAKSKWAMAVRYG
jgi:hypothetical protein